MYQAALEPEPNHMEEQQHIKQDEQGKANRVRIVLKMLIFIRSVTRKSSPCCKGAPDSDNVNATFFVDRGFWNLFTEDRSCAVLS
jgi:hypothetical protein